MTSPLDLSQLRSVVAIADTGGFGRAAAALHIAQPTVSQHVRALERRLGVRVLARAGRGTRFTADGERVLAEARRILAVHDEALERLEATARRTVVLGSTETAAQQVLPEMLRRLRAAFPDRPARFVVDRSTQICEAVGRGTVDIAILLGIDAADPGRPVGTLPLRWFSRPDLAVPLLADVPLVAYSEPCGMRRRALERLAAAGRRVQLVAESTSLEGVVAAARAGLGVAVLPTSGSAPTGLVERGDLPALDRMDVLLASRRGLDPDLEEAALEALTSFMATLPAALVTDPAFRMLVPVPTRLQEET